MRVPPILRAAAWLVPNEQREEWMAEWGGEAAYVRHRCGQARGMVFCLGAFPDALWLRRHQTSPGPVFLESPVRCLLFLAALATAVVCLAARSPLMREARPQAYLDPENLAIVSRHAGRLPRFAEIPLSEYRASVDRPREGFEDVAFYVRRGPWVRGRRFALAIASPNLFRLLGVPTSSSGLIVTRSACRRYFDSDPNLIGKMVQMDGKEARVAGVVSDAAWRLPGFIDGWLLDPERLAELLPETKGYMVARLAAPAQSNLRWAMATPNEDGKYGVLGLAPLPGDGSFAAVMLVLGLALIMLPLTASLSFGEFPIGCRAPRWTARVRWWIFLGVKIALLLPIVFGSFLALGVLAYAAQMMVMALIVAMRWALHDQRNRCPVCLRSLSHPVRIGEASHTFLEWYGTEFLCVRGHGFLHVPEIRTSSYAEPRWLVG